LGYSDSPALARETSLIAAQFGKAGRSISPQRYGGLRRDADDYRRLQDQPLDGHTDDDQFFVISDPQHNGGEGTLGNQELVSINTKEVKLVVIGPE
jgi:hypothetical protein